MAYESRDPAKRPALQGERVPVSTYLEVDDYDQLVELAERNERTIAGELRNALRRYLETEATAA